MHFDPVSRLIAAGTDIDITTFHITAEELRCLRRITTPWPPVIPEVGNGVLVCGLPGETRLTPRPGLLDMGYSTALMRVDSVTDRTISMMMQPNKEMIDILGIGLPPPSRDIGGMSGGPVAAVVTSKSGALLLGHFRCDYRGTPILRHHPSYARGFDTPGRHADRIATPFSLPIPAKLY